MNLFSKKVSLALLGAVLVLSGCAKKPQRPTPDQTALGPAGGGINPGDANFNSELQSRNDALLAGGDRTALEAQTVYFDYDKSDIKAGERPKLQATKDYLDKNPDVGLRLEGFCDWRGTAEYNLGLSERRAGAVKSYLEKLGVPAAKLETLPKGDTEAKEKGTEEEMAKDRKVALVVIKK